MSTSRYGIGSVDRALVLLREIAEHDSVSFDKAVKLSDSAKSTAFRLLETLAGHGLVERNPSGGYRAGPELVRWGLLVQGRLDLPNAAASDMQTLWSETGETVGIAIYSGQTIVITKILESPAPFRMAELPGTVVSPHSSALGKAILANLPSDTLGEIVGPEPFAAVTPNSPVTMRELMSRLATVREDGYALDIGESALGVACVAAPIFMNGQVAGGISIAGPRVRMNDEQLARLGPLAAAAAVQISERLSVH